jgi:hypothetical protein
MHRTGDALVQIFTIARFCHCGGFLMGFSPLRSIAYLIGLLSGMVMAVLVLVKVANVTVAVPAAIIVVLLWIVGPFLMPVPKGKDEDEAVAANKVVVGAATDLESGVGLGAA